MLVCSLIDFGCVAVCCYSVLLQCVVAVCCGVLQCVAVRCGVLQRTTVCCNVLQCVALCCSMLQCVALCCTVLQCVAVCCSVLQCVPVWTHKRFKNSHVSRTHIHVTNSWICHEL